MGFKMNPPDFNNSDQNDVTSNNVIRSDEIIKKDLDENRAKPPQENMWQDWSEHLNEAPETFSDEMARSQNLID